MDCMWVNQMNCKVKYFFKVWSLFDDIKNRVKLLGYGENPDIRFFLIETFPFCPKLDTITTDTQHQ